MFEWEMIMTQLERATHGVAPTDHIALLVGARPCLARPQ